MKAIIEIPEDLIRSAGSAIALSKPHLMDEAIEAMRRLAKVDELTLNFNGIDQKDTVEEGIAMMCVTQTMAEIVTDNERN
jgi:phosphoglycerate dehydrogenase-like enzyme